MTWQRGKVSSAYYACTCSYSMHAGMLHLLLLLLPLLLLYYYWYVYFFNVLYAVCIQQQFSSNKRCSGKNFIPLTVLRLDVFIFIRLA